MVKVGAWLDFFWGGGGGGLGGVGFDPLNAYLFVTSLHDNILAITNIKSLGFFFPSLDQLRNTIYRSAEYRDHTF